jgi:hypothetical protein
VRLLNDKDSQNGLQGKIWTDGSESPWHSAPARETFGKPYRRNPALLAYGKFRLYIILNNVILQCLVNLFYVIICILACCTVPPCNNMTMSSSVLSYKFNLYYFICAYDNGSMQFLCRLSHEFQIIHIQLFSNCTKHHSVIALDRTKHI